MMIRLCTIITALLLMPVMATARPFTARDLVMMDRVSDPNLSPDGRTIAFTLRSTDWDGNKGTHSLQLIDRTSPNAPPIILAEKENGPASPRWSKDGKWIYFLSSRSGTSQVWRISPDGQNRTQMTALPLDITSFRLSPDERSLIAVIDVLPECATLACTKAAQDAKAKVKASGMLIKGQARNWNHYEDDYYTGLFRVAMETGGAPVEAVPLLRNFRADIAGDSSFTIAQDGRIVYFSTNVPGIAIGADASTRLFQVPTDGSAAPSRLLPDSDTSDSQPVLSPDGTKLAWLANPLYESANQIYSDSTLMLLDMKSGLIRKIASGMEISATRIKWTADASEILFAAEEIGQTPLFAIDMAKGNIRKITNEGHVTDFDGAGGFIAYVHDSLTAPGQIFDVGSSGASRQLSHFNANILAEAPLSPAEQFSFAGWNDEKVYGYVVKPQGFVEGKKYPVVFLIHGGPQSSFTNIWNYRWNAQAWSGAGFAVVIIDFHGSTGYGEEFANSILGHWGDRPLTDLQKGLANALSRYSWLDGNNACAIGGSYGGYMINWMASQWNKPWKCLISHASVFDMRSVAFSMDLTSFANTVPNPGYTATSSRYAEHLNPASHADKWKTPMLVIHGGIDYRVPIDQGIAAYTAAQWFKVPSELLVFPDEGHWILKPQNSVQWYDHVEAWMKRWIDK